jgi:hypothetical protein
MPRTKASNRTSSLNRVSTQNIPCSLTVNAEISLAQTSGLPIFRQTGYSVAGRFKLMTSPSSYNDKVIYNESNSGNSSAFTIEVYNQGSNTMRVRVVNNAGTVQLDRVSALQYVINSRDWNDFVWTDNNGTATLYINGVKDSQNYNYTPSTYTMNRSSIGNYAGNGGGYGAFSGKMLQVMLIPAILNSSQALAYHLLSSLNVTTNGYYPLQEGAGTVAYDISGNGNNGTITAGTYTSDVPTTARKSVGGNMVYNGNFEFAPPTSVPQTSSGWVTGTTSGSSTNNVYGWQFIVNSGTGLSSFFDTSTSHSGNYSFNSSTTTSTGNSYTGSIKFPVSPSTSYTCTFWMKTTVVTAGAGVGANMKWQEYTTSGSGGNSYYPNDINTTTNWTQYALTYTTGATAAFLQLQLQNNGAGLALTAWFDDIVLTPTTNTTRGPAV